jgi:hypothetical protein
MKLIEHRKQRAIKSTLLQGLWIFPCLTNALVVPHPKFSQQWKITLIMQLKSV